ncbi:MAG: hypothetical protein HKN40_08370 [Winogradskyella sp.]|uniref:lipopolysaccharide biosynthesis protein n=1 Tax=Winogradskyella sp. TaxID=1883156 RepID=UPI0018241BC3|nr:hypothetical protein [Winogradskyella sp.]
MNKYLIPSKYNLFKLLNLALRVMPLAVKFLFFTVLSKAMHPEAYGSYTLITTTITISIFLLGFDFYNYSIREVLLTKTRESQKLFSTFSLYLTIYLLFSCVAAGYVFMFEDTIGFSIEVIIYLVLICFSEHFCQEAYRLQIAYKKILLANVLFFFRIFTWMIYLTIKVVVYKESPSIEFILYIWMVFNLITVVLNILSSFKPIINNFSNLRLDLNFIKKGLIISSLFFAGTLSLKTIEYFNRYVVDFFLGKEITGVFSFYSNLALVISVYINAIVISFELPALIEKGNSSDINQYFKSFKRSFLKQIIIIVTLLIIAIFPILEWQNIPMYRDYLYIFFILIFASALINYSLVYHFYLYIKKKDKTILILTLKSGVFNLITTIALTYLLGVLGTCLAFLSTSICLIYLRKVGSKKIGYE